MGEQQPVCVVGWSWGVFKSKLIMNVFFFVLLLGGVNAWTFQTCVRSTATSHMMTTAVGLPSQGSTVWMPAAAQWAWPGALSVTNVQKREVPTIPSCVLGVQASLIEGTSLTADPSLKVLPVTAGSSSCGVDGLSRVSCSVLQTSMNAG